MHNVNLNPQVNKLTNKNCRCLRLYLQCYYTICKSQSNILTSSLRKCWYSHFFLEGCTETVSLTGNVEVLNTLVLGSFIAHILVARAKHFTTFPIPVNQAN